MEGHFNFSSFSPTEQKFDVKYDPDMRIIYSLIFQSNTGENFHDVVQVAQERFSMLCIKLFRKKVKLTKELRNKKITLA